MKSSWATWGTPTATGEDKFVSYGSPIQPGYIPATSFIMQAPNVLRPYAPLQFRVSRRDRAWFMIAACWYGAPALAERSCNVSVISGSNLPHDLPYQPIMLTAEEWVHGVGAGSMSLATMQVDPL
jgi:hypothetical protein